MKLGLNLPQLAQQIKDEAAAKRDFLADTRNITSTADRRLLLRKSQGGDESFAMNGHFRNQIAEKLGIPSRYFDRMYDAAPELMATNVNHWLHAEPKRQMVRTLNGNARAFLSNSYRPLDNVDVAANVLPRLLERSYEVRSSQITEKHLYIQAVTQRLSAEIKVGDAVQAGVVLSNSEVGCGSLKVELMLFRLVCSNGMISGQGIRRAHLGAKMGGTDDGAVEFFSDETRRKTDAAFWSQVNDVVNRVCQQDLFQSLVADIRAKAENELPAPTKTVELTGKRFGLTTEETSNVLDNLIKGRDLSQWGLTNAVTALQHTSEDYERSIELSRIGGDIIELPRTDSLFNPANN